MGRSCLGHHRSFLSHGLLVIDGLLTYCLLVHLLLIHGALVDRLLGHGRLAHRLLAHGLRIHGLLWKMLLCVWHCGRNVSQGGIVRLGRHLSMVRCSRTRARNRQLCLLRPRAILDIVLYGRRVRRGVDLRVGALLRLMWRVMLIGSRVLCENWFIRRWWRITLVRSLTQSIAIVQACSKRQTRMAGRRRHDGRDGNRDATRAEGQLPVSSKKSREGKGAEAATSP